MKKTLTLIALAIMISACAALLCGCQCEHEWIDATCTSPKICKLCGETEGAALGHLWADATCDSPAKCSECGATRGDALEHQWKEATCTEGETCELCGATRGEKKGHIWLLADCTSPMHCAYCGETKGEALGHEWIEADCESPKTCQKCGATEGEALGHELVRGVCSRCGGDFGIWEKKYYVDADGNPTSNEYYTVKQFVIGSFSEGEDEGILYVQPIVDTKNGYQLILYEKGSTRVTNTASTPREYDVAIIDSDENSFSCKGSMNAINGERVFLYDGDVKQAFANMINREKDLRVSVMSKDSSGKKYSFTLEASNISNFVGVHE